MGKTPFYCKKAMSIKYMLKELSLLVLSVKCILFHVLRKRAIFVKRVSYVLYAWIKSEL